MCEQNEVSKHARFNFLLLGGFLQRERTNKSADELD